MQAGVVDQALGHAEHLLQGAAQPGDHPPRRLRHQLGAADLHHLQAGEVLRGGCGGLRPQQRQRRHQADTGDPLARDQAERGLRARARAQHHTATGVQRAEEPRRAHREVVRGRQRDQIDAVLGDAADRVAGAEGIQVVVVRARDQLGQPRAAPGDLQERNRLRVRIGGQLFKIARQHLQRGEPGRVTGDDDVLHLGYLRLQFARKGAVIEPLVAGGSDIGIGLGLAREMRNLGDAVRGQCIHGNQTRAEQPADHGHEFRHVAKLHHHPVTRDQALREQASADAAGLLPQLGIGEARITADHRDITGEALGAFAQEARKGLAAPMAGRAIARDQGRRPDLAQRHPGGREGCVHGQLPHIRKDERHGRRARSAGP
ncbi:hypothetical protein D3C71_1304190 [compost metagenome]